MKILSEWKPEPVECDYCWARLEYDHMDVRIQAVDSLMYGITCPVCQNDITLSSLPPSWRDMADTNK